MPSSTSQFPDGPALPAATMPVTVLTIASGQSVAINGAVSLASGTSVAISSLPAVTLAAGQSVNIGSLPTVSLAPTQTVNVGSITTLPAVTLAAGQTLGSQNAGDYISINGTAYQVKRGFIELTIAIAGISGNAQCVAAVTGKKIRMLSSKFSAAVAFQARWMSNTTQIGARFSGSLTTPTVVEPFTSYGWRDTNVGEALKIDISTTAIVGAALIVGVDFSWIEI